MRITKVQDSWWGYLATTIVVILLVAGVAAINQFNIYKGAQSAQLEITSAPDDAAEFESAKIICAELPTVQRGRCFDERRESRVAENRAQADLKAQQDMAVWAYGVFLVSLFGLVFSAGGFIALVWTFRETRKMTQAQDRAYVVVGTARLFQDPTYGLIYGLEVKNSGNTPATFVSADLHLTVTFPDPNDRTVARSETFAIRDVVNEVPAKAVGHLNSGVTSRVVV